MKIRILFILPFTLLYTISTLGIPVYLHACHAQARTWSSVYIPAKSCCSGDARALSSPCHTSDRKSYPSFYKKPCCESHHGLVQLAGDYFQAPSTWKNLPDFISSHALFENVFCQASLFAPEIIGYSSHGPPVKPPGREILIAFQRFLC